MSIVVAELYHLVKEFLLDAPRTMLLVQLLAMSSIMAREAFESSRITSFI